MDFSSIAIITIVSVSGFYFHWWLYVRIKRWVNRDLALSLAGQDEGKRHFMLEKLAEAEHNKVPKKELQAWLENAVNNYQQP